MPSKYLKAPPKANKVFSFKEAENEAVYIKTAIKYALEHPYSVARVYNDSLPVSKSFIRLFVFNKETGYLLSKKYEKDTLKVYPIPPDLVTQEPKLLTHLTKAQQDKNSNMARRRARQEPGKTFKQLDVIDGEKKVTALWFVDTNTNELMVRQPPTSEPKLWVASRGVISKYDAGTARKTMPIKKHIPKPYSVTRTESIATKLAREEPGKEIRLISSKGHIASFFVDTATDILMVRRPPESEPLPYSYNKEPVRKTV